MYLPLQCPRWLLGSVPGGMERGRVRCKDPCYLLLPSMA